MKWVFVRTYSVYRCFYHLSLTTRKPICSLRQISLLLAAKSLDENWYIYWIRGRPAARSKDINTFYSNICPEPKGEYTESARNYSFFFFFFCRNLGTYALQNVGLIDHTASTDHHLEICQNLLHLTSDQRRICTRSSKIFAVSGEGWIWLFSFNNCSSFFFGVLM